MSIAADINVEELKARFNEQGYVILRGVIDPSALAAAREDLDWLVNSYAGRLIDEGLTEHLYVEEPFETRLIRIYEKCMDKAPGSLRSELHLPGMFGIFFNPTVLDLAEAILGSEIRLYPNYTVRPKFPRHARTEVLWHQDGGYTAQGKSGIGARTDGLTVNDLRMVNVWTPFVPVRPENGCMQFIPGTHKIGVVDHLRREHYLEIVEEQIKPRLHEAVDVICDPGDVVLFNNLLFHRGQPNVSNIVRWSADWRYQDATQPTLRRTEGHLARSKTHPEQVVTSAPQWARLYFK